MMEAKSLNVGTYSPLHYNDDTDSYLICKMIANRQRAEHRTFIYDRSIKQFQSLYFALTMHHYHVNY